MAIVPEILFRCARGSRILDLGAGSGRHALFLAEQGYEVDAIDISPRAVAELQARAAAHGLAIRAEVKDACSPEIDFSSYHAVICQFVLHFLTPDRAHEVLDRARGVATPGTVHAIAAITTHSSFFYEATVKGAHYYPEPGEIAARYRACGWQVHRDWAELRDTMEKRPDGTPKRALVSFTLAGM